MDYEDLDTYNGKTDHDMWADFTCYDNTGDYIDKLNDWN